MKYLKLIILSGIAVVLVLGLGFVLLRFFHAPDPKANEEPEVLSVSKDVVELVAETEAFDIEIVDKDSASVSPDTVVEGKISAADSDTVSEDNAQSISDDDADPVSANDAGIIASKEEETVSENESIEEPVKEEGVPEDTRAPFFLSFNGNPMIKTGDAFDIHKYIGYADDVDRHVDLEVAGEVDTSAEGSYPLTVTLRDDAGKTASQKMTVKVVSEMPPGGGYAGAKEEFADFRSKYKAENTMVGIDISRWQETVDFEKVRDAGCEFVYMRIGGRDEGELYTDRYYLNNIAGAKAAGLKVGIYWHAEESNAEEVKESVAYLLGVLGDNTLDFPIAYDWEDFLHFENYGMNIYDLNNNLDVFADEIRARGYEACLYNSKYYLETVWSSAAKHPLWLAHYVNSTNYQGQYFMWQHGCTGRIDGINGDVDLDVYYY